MEETKPGTEQPDSLVSLALTPVRVAVSKPARRAYLTTALFLLASILLYGVAIFAYSLFYFNYIPQIGLEKVVHLQFGTPSPHNEPSNSYASAFTTATPWGITALAPSSLITQQPYDITVTLDLPRSPPNLLAGNFMLDLSLLSSTPSSPNDFDPSTILASSRRPTTLTYESTLVTILRTSSRALWLLLGWAREAESLQVRMMDEVQFPRRGKTPAALRLEIHSSAGSRLQVYSARVKFEARFYGLRYVMYNYRVISLVVFSTAFWVTEVLFLAVGWGMVATVFTSTVEKGDGEEPRVVKEEGESELDLSDTERSFPTTSRQAPLRYSRVKKEEDDEEGGESLAEIVDKTGIAPLTPGVGEAADDEDEDDYSDEGLWKGQAQRGMRTDSGIGTSLDDAASGRDRVGGVQRRRSRGSAGRE